jgi:hypothetical protein
VRRPDRFVPVEAAKRVAERSSRTLWFDAETLEVATLAELEGKLRLHHPFHTLLAAILTALLRLVVACEDLAHGRHQLGGYRHERVVRPR